MEKDFSIRNIVWFSIILVSAGSVYGMMSEKLQDIESKQNKLKEVSGKYFTFENICKKNDINRYIIKRGTIRRHYDVRCS